MSKKVKKNSKLAVRIFAALAFVALIGLNVQTSVDQFGNTTDITLGGVEAKANDGEGGGNGTDECDTDVENTFHDYGGCTFIDCTYWCEGSNGGYCIEGSSQYRIFGGVCEEVCDEVESSTCQ